MDTTNTEVNPSGNKPFRISEHEDETDVRFQDLHP
jgi:hypothetical protein